MLTSSQAIRFSSADFGKELFWEIFDLFALYFMVNALNLPPSLAGSILMATLFADALADPILGMIFDRMGKSRKMLFPLFVVCPIICSIFILIFYSARGDFWGFSGVLILLVLIFRIFYSLVDIPINAVTAYLARSEGQKSRMWGMRKAGATAAALLLSAFGTRLRDALGSDGGGAAFLLPVMLLCVVACGAYAISWGALPRAWRVEPMARRGDVLAPVIALLKNARFWGMILLLFLNASIFGMLARATIFLAPEGTEGAGFPSYSSLLAAMVAGRVLSIAVVSMVSIERGRRVSLWLVLATLWLSSLGLCIAAGEFFLLLLFAANGFSVGGIALVAWSYSPDMADEDSVAAQDAVATSLALFSMAVKLGAGLGTALLAGLLSIHGAHSADIFAQRTEVPLLQSILLVTLAGAATATLCAICLPPFRRPRLRGVSSA